MNDTTSNAADPVLERRAQFARAASLGNRVGYSCFAAAMVAFFIGLTTSFTTWGWVMIAALLVGSAVLLPAIIIGYAVKAAERHDLGLPDGH